MHREEESRQEICAQCGRSFSPESESGFRFGAAGVLCWVCAIERGGKHDTLSDAWIDAPDLQGLPDEACGPPFRITS